MRSTLPIAAHFLMWPVNFHSKQTVMRLLDQMAAWMMNRFHFHLSDDEGWRIEIPGLPELTDVGTKRCHDLTEKRCLLPQLGSGPLSDNNGSGYFRRADYIEIVKYAQARHIQVIPQIDRPAHARAAVIAMEARYQRLMKAGEPEQASAYRLIDPTDGANTTSVQLYDRTSYLNPCIEGGTRFNDERKIFSFALDNLPQNAETSVDRHGNVFSAKSEKPWSGAYGLSAQLWSETVRTDAQMEHMIFPRLFAVAE